MELVPSEERVLCLGLSKSGILWMKKVERSDLFTQLQGVSPGQRSFCTQTCAPQEGGEHFMVQDGKADRAYSIRTQALHLGIISCWLCNPELCALPRFLIYPLGILISMLMTSYITGLLCVQGHAYEVPTQSKLLL